MIPVPRKADDVVSRADDPAHPLSPSRTPNRGRYAEARRADSGEHSGLFPCRSHLKVSCHSTDDLRDRDVDNMWNSVGICTDTLRASAMEPL